MSENRLPVRHLAHRIKGTPVARVLPACGARADARARRHTRRTRAALGTARPAIGPELRGARWTETGRGLGNTQQSRVLRKRGLGLSQRWLRLRWRVPRWSAERRARPAGRAAAPPARQSGWMRLSALRFPSSFEGRSFFLSVGKTRAQMRVARTISCVVIAGLDPAIHAAAPLALFAGRWCGASAWTTGSSPVVTSGWTVHAPDASVCCAARAPSTALTRGPPPPLARGRKVFSASVASGARSSRWRGGCGRIRRRRRLPCRGRF